MIKLIVFAVIAVATAAPSSHSMSLLDDGTYQFSYDTGREGGSHSRSESRGPDGVVVGKYSYEDPSGDIRVINYRAGDFGYVAKGDIGVTIAPDEPADHDTRNEEPTDDQQDVTKDTEEVKPSVIYEEDEDEEDDAKPMKLPEPSDDGPPEGFPPGFFAPYYEGLRRLGEPKTEDKDEEKSSSADTKPGDSAVQSKSPNFHYSTFTHHWPVQSLHHHPVYVYSYHQPQAHGYYYHYY